MNPIFFTSTRFILLLHITAGLLIFSVDHWRLDFKLGLLTIVFFSVLAVQPSRRLNWVFPLNTEINREPYGVGLALSLAIVVLVLWWKEGTDAYYFTQNDSLVQYLPIIKGMLQLMIQDPGLPTWSAYQSMGLSLISGGYALFYPPVYIAYLLAYVLFYNPDMTIEVLAWMHIIAGHVILFFALRRLGVRPAIALPLTLCHSLAGFYFTQGRSWLAGVILPAYIPMLCYSLAAFFNLRDRGLRWALGSGAGLGFFFYMSHTELWFYGVLLWGIGCLWISIFSESHRFYRLKLVLVATFCAAIISLPLGLLQIADQQNVPPTGEDIGVHVYLLSMLWPAGLSEKTDPVYFFGAVPLLGTLFFLLFGAAASVARRQRGKLPLLTFPVLALICYMAMWGSDGVLWPLLKEWEPFSKFRWLWKWVPFFAALCVVSCAILAEAVAQNRVRLLKPVQALVLLGALLTFCNSFYAVEGGKLYGDDPYPTLAPRLQTLRGEKWKNADTCRVLTLGFNYSDQRDFLHMLPLNVATQYHVFAAGRYPQRVGITPEYETMRKLLREDFTLFVREFGICQLICTPAAYDYILDDFYQQRCDRLKTEGKLEEPSKEYYNGTIYDLSKRVFKPLAYIRDNEAPVPFTVRPNGLDMVLPPVDYVSPYHVIANFLYHPWFKAYMQTGSQLQVGKDWLGRVQILATPNTREIRLRFSPPWINGVLLAFVMLICLVWCVRQIRKDER